MKADYRKIMRFVMCAAVAMWSAIPAGADDISLAVSPGDWATDTHWSPQRVPTDVDTVYINNSRMATVAAGTDAEAAEVRVGYADGVKQNGALTVNGSLVTVGDIILGDSQGWSNRGSSATLVQGDNSTISVGGRLIVGKEWLDTNVPVVYTVPATGTLNLGSSLLIANGCDARATFTYNSTVQPLTVPGDVSIGYVDNITHVNHWGYEAVGNFVQGADTDVRIAGHLYVGREASTDRNASTTGSLYTVPASGTLTFTGSDSSLRVAYGEEAEGTFVYNGTVEPLVVPGGIVVGYSSFANSRRSYYGTFAQGEGTEVQVNELIVGGQYSTGANYTVAEGGTLNLVATVDNPTPDLLVGARDSAQGATFAYNNTTTPLTVPGDVIVGLGRWGRFSSGSVVQGAGTQVDIAGDLRVGQRWGNVESTYIVPETGKLNFTGADSSLMIAHAVSGGQARGEFTYNGTLQPLTVPGNVDIGYMESAGNANDWGYPVLGSLVQGANTEIVIGGNLTVGRDSSSGTGGVARGSIYTVPETGKLTFSGDDSSLRVAYGPRSKGTFTYNGTEQPLVVPGSIIVGYSSESGRPSYSGTFIQGPGTAVVAQELIVGADFSNGASYTVADTATLTLADLNANLHIAYGRAAVNTVFTYNGTVQPLTVPGNVVIGHATVWNQRTNGSFVQGEDTEVRIGGNLAVGSSWSDNDAYTVPATGRLIFTGDTSSLRVGGHRSKGAVFTYNGATQPLTIPGNVEVGVVGQSGYLAGGMIVQGDHATVAIGGDLTLGGQFSEQADYSLGVGASMTVAGATTIATASNSNGSLNVNGGAAGFAGNVTVGANGGVSLNNGTIRVDSLAQTAVGASFEWNGGTLAPYNGHAVVSLPVTLAGNGAIFHTEDRSGTARSLAVNNPVGESGGSYGIDKAGQGTLTLAGANTYSGDTVVGTGTLALSHGSNNNIPDSRRITVADGATLDVTGLGGGAGGLTLSSAQTLGGSGTVTGDTVVSSSANLSPGMSTGILSTDNLTLAGNAFFEITGTTPGSEFDQVLGSEGSAVTFQDGWVLKLFIRSIVPITADLKLFQFDQYNADEDLSFSIDFVRGRAEAWSFDATTGILSLTGAVPEPTSLALFALGALALVKRRR